MSTNINVTVGGNQLVDKSKAAQQANRVQFLESRQDKAAKDETTEKVAAQIAAQQLRREGAVPEYQTQEQTSAQRKGGGIAGINGSTERPWPADYDLLSLEVVEPGGVNDSIEEEFPDIPAFPITIPQDVDTTESTGVGDELGFSTVHQIIKQYKFWSDSGSSNNLFILPVDRKTAIFVYHIHKFRREAVSEKTYERFQEQEGYYFQNSPGFQTLSYRGTVSVSINFQIIQNYIQVTNEAVCYVFDNKKIRQINMPVQLLNKLLRFIPIKLQGSVKPGTGGSVSFSGPYDTGPTPSVEFTPPTYVNGIVEFLNDESNLNQIALTDPGFSEQFLARSFGLGNLTSNNHSDLSYFSPAVYTFIDGNMDLGTNNTHLYDYMRTEYFTNAPRSYVSLDAIGDITGARGLAQSGMSVSAISGQLNRSEKTIARWLSYASEEIPPVKFFQVTKKNPRSIEEAMEDKDFSDFNLGYRGFYNAWDWGNPQFCRSRLLALGFTSSDLSP